MNVFAWDKVDLPEEIKERLTRAPSTMKADNREELMELALGGRGADVFNVEFDVRDRGRVAEAWVVRCRNGIGVNYTEPYMRRRDPECLVVADQDPSDQSRFDRRFGYPFDSLRGEILDWLAGQPLLVVPFRAGGSDLCVGGPGLCYDALLVAPANAAFFAAALADLQGMLPGDAR